MLTGKLSKLSYILLFLFTVGSLEADVLFLKNSRYYKGKVTGQDLNKVFFTTKDGLKLSVSKRKIRKILYIPRERQQELDQAAKQRAEARLRARRRAEEERRRLEEERIKNERRAAELRKQRAEEARLKREAENKARREQADRQRDQALWRSAVLPGWGQHYLGQKRRGYYFGGAAGGALFLWFVFDRRYNSAIADHEASSTLALAGINDSGVAAAGFLGTQAARADADKQAAWATRFSWIFLGVYLYNLYDAYFNYEALTSADSTAALPTSGRFSLSVVRRPSAPASRLSSFRVEEHLTLSFGLRF